METRVEQLRFVLDSVQKMLDEHPTIESGISRAPVINCAGAAFELRLFAYGKTGDMRGVHYDSAKGSIEDSWNRCGRRFRLAAPTRLTYLHPDPVSM